MDSEGQNKECRGTDKGQITTQKCPRGTDVLTVLHGNKKDRFYVKI